MDYVAPTIADYGDVAQLTAAMQNRDIGDYLIQAGQTLGNQNSTGLCQTGYQDTGSGCVPIPPGP